MKSKLKNNLNYLKEIQMRNKTKLSLSLGGVLLALAGTVAAQQSTNPGLCFVATQEDGTFTSTCSDGVGAATVTGAGLAAGYNASATEGGVALGGWSTAAWTAVSIGESSSATGDKAIALGNYSDASATNAIAIGTETSATSMQSIAFGYSSNASGISSLALGAFAETSADFATAVGAQASASGDGALALGVLASASGVGSVAIGKGSIADEAMTVSFGDGTYNRRLVNLNYGIFDTDAATVGQLNSAASAFGGGAGFFNGVFQAPTYVFLSGSSFNNVGSALAYLDGRVNTLENAGPGPAGPAGADGKSAYEVAQSNGFTGSETEWLASLKGETGAQGPQGEPGQEGEGAGKDPYFTADADGNTDQSNPAVADGAGAVAAGASSSASGDGSVAVGKGASATAENSVALGAGSVADQANTVSVGSAGNERQVTHVAAGVNATDAVNVAQMQAGDIATLNSANSYTDIRSSQTLESANAYTDWRISQLGDEIGNLDRRINQVGAQGAALTMMASSALNLEPGEVAVQAGWGQYGNQAAFAVGAKIRTSPRSAVNMGLSVVNGKAMGGIGVSWNLGR